MIGNEKNQSKNQWLTTKMLASHPHQSNVRRALLQAAVAHALAKSIPFSPRKIFSTTRAKSLQ